MFRFFSIWFSNVFSVENILLILKVNPRYAKINYQSLTSINKQVRIRKTFWEKELYPNYIQLPAVEKLSQQLM